MELGDSIVDGTKLGRARGGDEELVIDAFGVEESSAKPPAES
jgi:hypothetical protein